MDCWLTVIGVRARRLAHSPVVSSPTRLIPCCVRRVSPLKNTRATINRPMALFPRSVMLRFFSVFLVPLSTHKAVSRDEFLHDEHVAIEIALAAQAELFRSGNEGENLPRHFQWVSPLRDTRRVRHVVSGLKP